MNGTTRYTVRMQTGATIEVKANARLTGAAVWVEGQVSVDGIMALSRTWDLALSEARA